MHQAKTRLSPEALIALDRAYAWHPYSPVAGNSPLYPVRSASGCRITLADGRELIDGMASWWSAIHGYNRPALNAAIGEQLTDMAHVMFGGLTHEPAARLCEKLVALTPEPLQKVFLSDSGSVSVEVAIKMALQYQIARGKPGKHRLLALRGAYHGDTLGAMSVCDPVTGMHQLFAHTLPQQLFADRPDCPFGAPATDQDMANIAQLIQQHQHELAAVIIEPVVQGAGGMHFYSADYVRRLRQLCDQHDVLLIADEIATGFGRTGKLFACEHAGISPDILCVGKALTGGMMTLAATLCTDNIATAISSSETGAFMHGPTFMGNPLACATALASIQLLLESHWQADIQRIEAQLKQQLLAASTIASVKAVRVLGAIGVVELHTPVDMHRWQPALVGAGIWVRPFGKLVYVMPPYIISDEELRILCEGIITVTGQMQANA